MVWLSESEEASGLPNFIVMNWASSFPAMVGTRTQMDALSAPFSHPSIS
jgi:hypothetical protein